MSNLESRLSCLTSGSGSASDRSAPATFHSHLPFFVLSSSLRVSVSQVEKRGGEVDGKLKQLDEELLRYKAQLSKMRPGPAKNQVQQRALRVLKQKKMSDRLTEEESCSAERQSCVATADAVMLL